MMFLNLIFLISLLINIFLRNIELKISSLRQQLTDSLLACSSTIDTINVFVFFEVSKWNVRISLLVFKQLPICSRLELRHKQSSVFNKSILSTHTLSSIPCSCRSFTDNTSFSARNYLSPFCAAEHECFVLSRRNFKRHEQRQDKWAEKKVFQFTCENVQYFLNLLLILIDKFRSCSVNALCWMLMFQFGFN